MRVRLRKKSLAEERFKTVAIKVDGPLLEGFYRYIPEELPPLRRGIGGYYPRMEADEGSDQCAKLRAEELRLRVRNKDKLKPKKLMQVRLWKTSLAEERCKTVAIKADGPLLESCGTVLDVTNGTEQFGEAGGVCGCCRT